MHGLVFIWGAGGGGASHHRLLGQQPTARGAAKKAIQARTDTHRSHGVAGPTVFISAADDERCVGGGDASAAGKGGDVNKAHTRGPPLAIIKTTTEIEGRCRTLDRGTRIFKGRRRVEDAIFHLTLSFLSSARRRLTQQRRRIEEEVQRKKEKERGRWSR